MNPKQLINEFERMKDLAEIKALSNFSLKNPLSNEQFERMMELKEKLFGERKI